MKKGVLYFLYQLARQNSIARSAVCAESNVNELTMKYRSTRGSKRRLCFEDVMINCYAEDGGLYVPENIPNVPQDKLVELSQCSYVQLCKEILKLFIAEEEYKHLQIENLVENAFTSFKCKEIIPIKNNCGIFVAELWHGKSMAFKDLAVSCVSRFTENYYAKKNAHANVICATSGDTGSSIMESLRGSKFIDVFTLYPEGRCSVIQERQLSCIEEENIHSFCTQGTSDDFDVVMENIFNDTQFSKKHNVISFSSLNWVRILVQIVHYFFAYLSTVEQVGDVVSIIVPSGGLGNLTAGYIAALMGLPIQPVAAVNQNEAAHRIFSRGDFSQSEEVLFSTSCSMDITIPLNIERILFLASDKDDTVVHLMTEFKKNHRVSIPEGILQKMGQLIQSASVSEDYVTEAIRETWSKNNYHIEPHTAVAMAIALHPERYNIKLPGNKVICLSCASPQKFPEIFEKEGIPFQISEEIKLLLTKSKRCQYLRRDDDWMQVLKKNIVAATEKFNETVLGNVNEQY